MSTAAAPTLSLPTRVDLSTWDAQVCFREDSYELVEGVPTMAPGESTFNRVVGVEVASILRAHRGETWAVGTDVDVTITEVPATVRRPDVVVMTRSAAQRDHVPEYRLLPGDVLFVAEVVSPSSVERDLVAKRRDYALAGIPVYLVVDLRDGRRELTLYAERGADGLFVDVAPTERVTVTIGGTPIAIAVGDILP